MSRPWLTGLLPALAAGLAARAWYFADLRLTAAYDFPIVDALTYRRLSETILSDGTAFFRPPLYPVFLSIVRQVAGEGQGPVVWAQFALGLAAVVPVYFLALRWRGPLSAALTAWIVSLYPLRIFFEGELLAVTFFGFLLASALWLFWCESDDISFGRLLVAGLVFGLAALTRPNVLLAAPVLCLGFVVGRPLDPRKVQALAVWIAGTALAIMPVALHNYRADGGVILVAANGGINFYLGNEPGASGETPLPPGLHWQAAVQAPLREGHLTLSSQDRYWWSEAGKSITADPLHWLGLLARKALFFLNARESSNNKDLAFFAALSPVTRYYRWWFGILFCLAAGAMVSAPRAAGNLRLASLFTGYWVAIAIFFVTARYRLPLVPFVAIPASAFLAELPRLLRPGRRKPWLPALAVLLAALAAFPPWFGYGSRQIDHDFQMGQIFLMRGEAEEAERHLIRALGKERGEQADIRNSLGAARFAAGDLEGAERYYLSALGEGEFSEVWFNLGVVYEAMGPSEKNEALRAYRRALEINPLEKRAAANRDYLLRQDAAPGN